MSKYSYDEKWNAVRLVVEEHLTDYEAARITGIPRSPLRRWVERYKQFGLEGLLLKHGSYDGAFKISVVEYMHNTGSSLRQTAAHFNIQSKETISKWERIYYENGKEALHEERRGGTRNMLVTKTSHMKNTAKTHFAP